jgi:hypothetical protein
VRGGQLFNIEGLGKVSREEHTMSEKYTVITVTLEDAPEGGLRVYSDDLPGLILSGDDREEVAACIVPAIRALLEYKGLSDVEIYPATDIAQVLDRESPRDLDMHVRNAVHQERFVVEVRRAA